MNEAAFLLSEGVEDRGHRSGAVDWGFPVGPITLLDEVGIDVGRRSARSCSRSSAIA
jgi:3-hydroxyacyl-CoA dehydrogenase